MKKNILFGSLIFTLGMFMVACGQQRAATGDTNSRIITPNQPAIALDADGNLSSVCSSSSCRFSAHTTVLDQDAFYSIGGGEYFAAPGSNAGSLNFDLGGSWGGQLEDIADRFEDSCGLQIGINLGSGNSGLDTGVNCNFNNSNGLALQSSYPSNLNYLGNVVQLVLEVPTASGNQNFAITAELAEDSYYYDSKLGVRLAPIKTNELVRTFVIQVMQNGVATEAARADIGSDRSF